MNGVNVLGKLSCSASLQFTDSRLDRLYDYQSAMFTTHSIWSLLLLCDGMDCLNSNPSVLLFLSVAVIR